MKPAVKKNKNRIWEIDFFRGICILLMVFDHTMFDFWYFPYWVSNFDSVNNAFMNKMEGFASFWWNWDVRIAVRIVIVFTFLLLSGMSCSLSKSNSKRLLKLAAASLILSSVTIIIDLIADLGISIYFGILHIMALSLLIYMLLKKLWNNKWLYLGTGLIIIAIGIKIDYMTVPYLEVFSYKNLFDSFVGTVSLGADSYGIIPYTGLFLVGAFYGEILYFDKRSVLPTLNKMWQKPVSFVGRNTIWVYLIHQPLIMGIVMGIGLILGYKI